MSRSPIAITTRGTFTGEVAITKLVEMKHVRSYLTNQRGEKSRRFRKIFFGFLHPLQTKSGGSIVQPMQVVHPGSLMRQGNFAEADKRDTYSAGDQAGHKFAGIGP